MLAKVIAEPTDTGPPRQSQFPIAHVLLATVAGISKQLLHATDKNKGTGARFKNASLGFPWDIDPPKGASNDEAAKILYDAFRNPLVRRLGLAGAPVVKIVQIFRATADAENRVEELERRTIKTIFESVPCRSAGETGLWLDPFYWGVRKLVERWSRDTDEVSRADRRFTTHSQR